MVFVWMPAQALQAHKSWWLFFYHFICLKSPINQFWFLVPLWQFTGMHCQWNNVWGCMSQDTPGYFGTLIMDTTWRDVHRNDREFRLPHKCLKFSQRKDCDILRSASNKGQCRKIKLSKLHPPCQFALHPLLQGEVQQFQVAPKWTSRRHLALADARLFESIGKRSRRNQRSMSALWSTFNSSAHSY